MPLLGLAILDLSGRRAGPKQGAGRPCPSAYGVSAPRDEQGM